MTFSMSLFFCFPRYFCFDCTVCFSVLLLRCSVLQWKYNLFFLFFPFWCFLCVLFAFFLFFCLGMIGTCTVWYKSGPCFLFWVKKGSAVEVQSVFPVLSLFYHGNTAYFFCYVFSFFPWLIHHCCFCCFYLVGIK